MLRMVGIWFTVIFAILLRSHFGACENLHQDSKDPWRELSIACTSADPKNSSISCHGVRIVKKVIQQLLDSASSKIDFSEDVSLVDSEDAGAAARRARNLEGLGSMGPILGFLEGKELRVKLPSLLPANLENAIVDSLPKGRGRGSGFRGGKKGGGNIMIMAIMMGKMMAAIGFGSLGMLAMKALMVSSMALMLSLIVAAKKFTSSSDSGGGHHVVYAQETGGHHHTKRNVNLNDMELSPYSGYASIYGISGSS